MFISKFSKTIPNYMARHCVKAGITGWAQVHGWRGNTSLRKRLQYDLYYITHWTRWLDLPHPVDDRLARHSAPQRLLMPLAVRSGFKSGKVSRRVHPGGLPSAGIGEPPGSSRRSSLGGDEPRRSPRSFRLL